MTAVTKTCNKCGDEKPIDQFYANQGMSDGHLNECKQCTCARVRTHRVTNGDSVRAYDRMRGQDDQRREKARLYGYEYSRTMRHKRSAQRKVSRAIDAGTLTRRPCVICGAQRVEAHHEDYSKPLDVIWLCPLHHKRWHHAPPILDLTEF